MAESPPPSAPARERAPAADDIDARRIGIAGLVLAAVVGAVIGVAFAIHAWLADGPVDPYAPTADADAAQRFPTPRLEARPGMTRERYLADQEAKATEFAWIDRANGVVRIPVAQAMSLLAAEHAASASRGDGR